MACPPAGPGHLRRSSRCKEQEKRRGLPERFREKDRKEKLPRPRFKTPHAAPRNMARHAYGEAICRRDPFRHQLFGKTQCLFELQNEGIFPEVQFVPLGDRTFDWKNAPDPRAISLSRSPRGRRPDLRELHSQQRIEGGPRSSPDVPSRVEAGPPASHERQTAHGRIPIARRSGTMSHLSRQRSTLNAQRKTSALSVERCALRPFL